ncbi:hypothetical protein [Anaerosolibacter sp.]|uniref:hypothetical protein n=1 Tax=Anaerosolibacter sp. TaxID=1872527 RepID=UPI0039EFFF61
MRLNIYVKDQEVFNFLKSLNNYSSYIVDLVKGDMKNIKPISREEVIELIKEYAAEKKNTSDYEVKKSVKELFDW